MFVNCISIDKKYPEHNLLKTDGTGMAQKTNELPENPVDVADCSSSSRNGSTAGGTSVPQNTNNLAENQEDFAGNSSSCHNGPTERGTAMAQKTNELAENQENLAGTSTSGHNGSTEDGGMHHGQRVVTKGNNNLTINIGHNSSVSVCTQCPGPRSSDCSSESSKRKEANDSNDMPSPKRLRCGKEYGDKSPSDSGDNQPSHNCFLEKKHKKAQSRRKGRRQSKLNLNCVPNLVYNSLKQKLYEMGLDDVEKCVKLLKQDLQGFGIKLQILEGVQSAEGLIELLEMKNLLSADNLCFLQRLLDLIGNRDQLRAVDDYARDHNDMPISLFISKTPQPDGTIRVEYRIEGDAKHTKTKTVTAFKKIMSKSLGVPEHRINLTGQASGSVILIFQMTETDVCALRQSIKASDAWLKECGVLGVHIEGEDYVEITPAKQKGTIQLCGDCKSSFLQDFFPHFTGISANTSLPVKLQDDMMKAERSIICAGCSHSLEREDRVHHVKEHVYHQRCFSCAICCQPISPGDEFFLRRDGKLLCVNDFKTVVTKGVKKFKIFSGVTSEITYPSDDSKPSDAMGMIELPKTIYNDKACQKDLPMMDELDAEFHCVAANLSPVEGSRVCASLGLLPTSNLTEKTMFEMLISWKQSILEKGVGHDEVKNRMQAAMSQANRHDLAKYICPDYQKGFDVEQCQRELQHYYLNKLCWLPLGCSDGSTNYVNIEDVYTDLALFLTICKPNQVLKCPLESYREMFSSKVYSGGPPGRIVLKGLTGSGKTSLIKKIAYEWATNAETSPLKDITLLFVLNMEEVDLSTNIEDAIITQLLPQDTDITAEQLIKYISGCNNQIMLILDGFSEAHSSGVIHFERKGSIVKAMSNTILQECRILVTTKAFYVDFDLGFTSIEVSGFSSESIKKYINKFFVQDEEIGEKLISYIWSSAIIKSIASIPLILLELCLIWNESKGTDGIRTAMFYKDILEKIFHQSQSTSRGKPYVDKLILQLGKLAFEGMCSTVATEAEGKISPVSVKDEVPISYVLELACQKGLMVCSDTCVKTRTQPMLLESEVKYTTENNLNLVSDTTKIYVRQVHFLHKTFHEFCAAFYFVSLSENGSEGFDTFLKAHNDVLKALSIQSVLLFACGLSSNAAKKILKGLLEIYTSQLEHSMKKYHRDELPYEETCAMQEFILLCLVCNYEANAMGKFNKWLTKLIPDGKMKFVAISDSDAIAIGYFLRHVKPGSIQSIKLQAVPKLDNVIKLDEFWRGVQCGPYKWPKPVSKNSGFRTVMDYLDKLGSDVPEQYRLIAMKTPLKLLAIFRVLDLCSNLPAEMPHTWEPIIDSLKDIQIERFDITGFKMEKNKEYLIKVMEDSFFPRLSKLTLRDIGLTGRQTERLVESLVVCANLEELDLSHNEAGGCFPILGTSLAACKSLRILDLEYMQAGKEDVVLLLKKFPGFASGLVDLNMTGNQMSDSVIHAFLEIVPNSSNLLNLAISLGDVSRRCNRLFLEGIQSLKSLQGLYISHSAFPDDLLFHTGNVCKSIGNISTLCLDVDLKVLPHVKHSTWVEFKSNLKQANKLKRLFLHNIALEKNDFEELIDVGCQLNLTHVRYYTSCLPEDTVVKPDYDFLELL